MLSCFTCTSWADLALFKRGAPITEGGGGGQWFCDGGNYVTKLGGGGPGTCQSGWDFTNFSNIFPSSPATYFSHRECVGLFLHRHRHKVGPIEKEGSTPKKGGSGPMDPTPRSALVNLPKQVCIGVDAPRSSLNNYCQLFPCIFPWNINIMYTIRHHLITEFMGISNFMLFENKQTFDAPSNAGVQCIYARNAGISLTNTWKQFTIINANLAFKYIFIIMTFWHNTNTCSGGGGGVWFQIMPLLLNTDWTKLLNLNVLVMGQKWK